MKFHQALILIYLIGVEAKSERQGVKVRSKAGRKQKISGSRSPLDDGLSAGRGLLDNINHGAMAASPSKYGHIGLNPGGNPGRKANYGAAVAELTGEHAIYSGLVQSGTSSESVDAVPKVNRSSSINEAENNGAVEIKRQGNQSGAQFGKNGVQQQSSSFESGLGQGGPYEAPPGFNNAQMQSPGQGNRLGSQFGPERAQGQYSSFSRPFGYPAFEPAPVHGSHMGSLFLRRNQGYPGIGIGLSPGQGWEFGSPYGQDGIQAQQSTFGQPANYYGSVLGQGGQPGVQLWQLQGQFGQPARYYGPGTNLVSQNGQPGASLQGGPYTGVGQPTNNYYGTAPGSIIPGQEGLRGSFSQWVSSLVTLCALGQSNGQLGNPTQPGQNPCPPGFVTLPGEVRCLPYCTNGETVGCVPSTPYLPSGLISGPYSGVHSQLIRCKRFCSNSLFESLHCPRLNLIPTPTTLELES